MWMILVGKHYGTVVNNFEGPKERLTIAISAKDKTIVHDKEELDYIMEHIDCLPISIQDIIEYDNPEGLFSNQWIVINGSTFLYVTLQGDSFFTSNSATIFGSEKEAQDKAIELGGRALDVGRAISKAIVDNIIEESKG